MENNTVTNKWHKTNSFRLNYKPICALHCYFGNVGGAPLKKRVILGRKRLLFAVVRVSSYETTWYIPGLSE